jgi:hypothetical protein
MLVVMVVDLEVAVVVVVLGSAATQVLARHV